MAQNKYLSLSGLEYFKDKIISIIQENELTTAAALNNLNNSISSKVMEAVNSKLTYASALTYDLVTVDTNYNNKKYNSFYKTFFSRDYKALSLGDIKTYNSEGILSTTTQTIAGEKQFLNGIRLLNEYYYTDYCDNDNENKLINGLSKASIYFGSSNLTNGTYITYSADEPGCTEVSNGSKFNTKLCIKNSSSNIILYNDYITIYNSATGSYDISNIFTATDLNALETANNKIVTRIDEEYAKNGYLDSDANMCSFISDLIYSEDLNNIRTKINSVKNNINVNGLLNLYPKSSQTGLAFFGNNSFGLSSSASGTHCEGETIEWAKENNKIYIGNYPGYIAYTPSDTTSLSIFAGTDRKVKIVSDTRILADLYLNESAESVQTIISGIKTTNTNQDTKISNIEQILETFIESFGITLNGTGTLLEQLNNALTTGQTTLRDIINEHAKDDSKHLPTYSLKEGSYFLNKDGSTNNISWQKGKLLPSATAQDQILVSTDSQDYIAEFKNISDVINTEPASGNYIYGDEGLEEVEAKSGLVTTGLQSFSGEKQFLDCISILPAKDSAWYTDNDDIESVSALYFSPDKNNFIKWSYLTSDEEDLSISAYQLNITSNYRTLIKSEIDNVEISGANIFIESGDTGSVEISSKSTAYNDTSLWLGEGAINIDAPNGLYINGEMYSGSSSSIDESVLKLYDDPFSLDNGSWPAGLGTSPCEDNRSSFIQTPITLKRNSVGDCGILFDNGTRADCEGFFNYIGVSKNTYPISTNKKSKTDALIINSGAYDSITKDPHSKIITKNNIYNSCKMFMPRASNITSYSYTNSNNQIPITYVASKGTYGEDFYLDNNPDLIISGSQNYLSSYLNTTYQYYVGFKFTLPNNAYTFYNNNYYGAFNYDCCDSATFPSNNMFFENRTGYYYDDDETWDDISDSHDEYGLVAVVYIVSSSSYRLERCLAYKGIYINFEDTNYNYTGILFFKPTSNATYYIKCCILTGRQYIYFKEFGTLIQPEYRLGFGFGAWCNNCTSYEYLYYNTKANATTSFYINSYFNTFIANSYQPNVLTYDFPSYLTCGENDVFTLQDNGILSYCNYSDSYTSVDNANLIKTNIYKIDNAEFLYKPLNLTYPDTATIFNISERNLLFTNLKLNDSLRNNEVYSWFNIDQRSIYMGVNNLNSGFNYSSLRLIDSDIELFSQTSTNKLSSAFKMKSNTITQRVHRTGNYSTYSILTDTAFYLVSSNYDNGPLNYTSSLYSTKVNIGSSSYRVGTVYASAALNTSDERFKEHQSDIDIDFDKLKTIPKFIFKWKDSFLKDDDDLHIGTSAQAIRDVYPEIVHVYNNDVELCAPRDIYDPDAVLAIEYDKLGVIALAAIDKLHEENVQLKEENEQLKTRLDNLEQLLKDKGII